MFEAARLKLTAFYLAVLLCFSLALTFGVRAMALHEYENSNQAQLGVISNLQREYFDKSIESFVLPPARSDFANAQQDQDSLVREHLNRDLVLFNLYALILGGILSFWYAGRTLKPIVDAHDAQKRFASDASHELRTPLANMQLENEVFLRQKSFTEDEARALISSNLEEVQRLESLANNLLQLSQYEHANLRMGSVSLRSLIDEALNHAMKGLEARDVHIDKKVAAALVVGEHESLERLLNIIIDNAIKYGPKKGTIYIEGQKGTNYVLTIRDEGSGIAAEDLPHIFDRLYRGDKARSTKAEGYGLGLALAKQIAIANHVTIRASNHPKGGAIFTLEFGLAKQQPKSN